MIDRDEEGAFVRSWESAVQYTAKRTDVSLISLSREDVASELRIVILRLYRATIAKPPGKPPGRPMVWSALRWARQNMWRSCRRKGFLDFASPDPEAELEELSPLETAVDPRMLTDESALMAERQTRAAEIVYGLRVNISARDLAVLHLRYVEEWTNPQVADNVGLKQNNVQRMVFQARQAAKEYLASQGIYAMEDLHG